eukprot:TRINITY_DN2810_c0_g1_i3.p2 TRINITY_DN2810_c0_g1~~TRINITY_DN2810_c0_g1_i3.p2  ORF type:complete len:372 (-),score=17.98 TRINITY_DN2810_c0_g1_i3:173-1288(-)
MSMVFYLLRSVGKQTVRPLLRIQYQFHFLSSESINGKTSLDLSNLEVILGPDVGENLLYKGYAVVDNALELSSCRQMKNEILALKGFDKLGRGSFQYGSSEAMALPPRQNVYEAELSYNKQVVRLAPYLTKWLEDRRLRTMLNVHLPMLRLDSQTVRVEYSDGHGFGTCYPMHTDSSADVDNREVTVVYFLNEDWQEQDGGWLRLYPWPNDPIDIQPINNRLVIYSAHNMVHRILPSRNASFSFTTWILDKRKKMQWAHNQSSLRDQLRQVLDKVRSNGSLHDVWRLLVQPQVRLQVIKYIYQHEWKQSLQETYQHDAALLNTLLEQQNFEAAVIGQALASAKDILDDMRDREDKSAGRMLRNLRVNVRWF